VTPFGRYSNEGSNGLRTGFAGCASHSPYNPLGVRRRPNALPWGRAGRFARIAARRAWRASAHSPNCPMAGPRRSLRPQVRRRSSRSLRRAMSERLIRPALDRAACELLVCGRAEIRL
jgi:hypothetical protein